MTQTNMLNDSAKAKKTTKGEEDPKTYICFRVLDIKGREIDLIEGEYFIGREPKQNTIVIDEFYNMVSRRHAVIDLHGSQCTFMDLPTSSNGSYFQHPEGEKIDPEGRRWRRMLNNAPYPIEKDTVIRLGGPFSRSEKDECIYEIEIKKVEFTKRSRTKAPENDKNKAR